MRRARRDEALTGGARPNVSVSSMVRKAIRQSMDPENNHASVPCGSCNRCCRVSWMLVKLTDEEQARLMHEPDPDGTSMVLPKDRSGRCVYLVDDKCSIYDQRPLDCRLYDCRLQTLVGVTSPGMEDVYQSWEPVRKVTHDDKVIFLAVRMAAASLMRKEPNASLNKIIGTAIGSYDQYLTTAEKMLSKIKQGLDRDAGQ